MIGIIIAAVIVAFILLVIFLPVVAWSILAFIALVLLLVLLIPVGLELSYLESKFSLSAKLSFFSYKLFPKKPKPEGGEAEKNNKAKKEKKPKDTVGVEKDKKKLALNFEEILEIIKKAMKGLSRFGKLKVHKFMLHYIAAGKDPYSTAMTYNYVNAALSSLAPLGAKAFIVKGDVDVWTDIDFLREKMLIDVELSITLRLVQVLHTALIAGFGVLGVIIKNKRRLSKERRMEKKQNKNLPQANNKKENKEINIQTEERMDSNG